MVLTHSDLNEMNILVNPDSGEITGVVDWTGASILPFGFTLYALENALGSMGAGGWEWFDGVDDLRGYILEGLPRADRLVRISDETC